MSYPVLPNLTPATPQRALPGAYLQTPAISRHASTQLGPSAQPQMPQTPLPKLAPAISTQNQSLSTEARGAKTVNDTLIQESRYPDLDSYLSQGFSSEYDIPTSQSWVPFQKIKMYSIPDQIFDQYNRAQVSTTMGLFAELNHAWVAIDNALYIWDFTHPNPQLVGFEEQPNSINSVRLVKPRPGVFLPAITHLLVVSTSAEVILLGMGCEPLATGGITVALYQLGMNVAIRGLDIHVFASSESGRIFFAGSTDNDVYELTYQQEERWFQGRCGKINHTSSRLNAFTPSLSFTNLTVRSTEHVEQMVIDDSRNYLYTLSSESTIRVFHLKQDGTMQLSITKQALDIYSNIGHIIPSNETLNPKVKIVSISPIPAAEASRYHLVATTATGYRIYLSATAAYSWSGASSDSNAPTSMQAQHVKTPPVDNVVDTGFPQFQPTGSRFPIRSLVPTHAAARFPPGYFFCFTSKDAAAQNIDTVFISAPDSGRVARYSELQNLEKKSETATWVNLGGRVEDIGLCSKPLPAVSGGFGNEMAIQFDQPAAEVAILTNTGIHVIRRRRLVDVFASLVRGGGNSEDGLDGEVKSFMRCYGRNEMMATSLAVACGQGVEMSPDQRLTKIVDPDVLDFARKVFIDFGGRPQSDDDNMVDKTIDDVMPSSRHNGTALYISRLLRSIWKTQIAKSGKGPNGAMTVSSSVATAKLQTVQHDLSALKEFFDSNKSFIEGLNGPEALARVSGKSDQISLQAEHRAMHSLTKLVTHTIEGISFVLVLFDERVDEIVATLPEESKQRFLQLTYEELFSTSKGHEIAKELVKGIVNRNIAKGSNVETVADALRRRCGSFCSAEDVMIFKAQELLKRATEAGANTELGRNLLNESLNLFEKVADRLPMDYLVAAVDNFISNQFFAGAIELALKVAEKSDGANLALSWIMDGRPEQDPRKEYFLFRKQCYDLIFKVTISVDKISESDPGFIDGQMTAVAKRRNEAYAVVAGSSDEVFLTSLYDWYLEQGWNERILSTQSPYVVTYLERKAQDDITHADLLWCYYAQAQRYFDAAKVQLLLAKSQFILPLSRRIEYLGRARANASTLTPDVGRQARQRLLQEVSELIDVANIQDDLLQRLKDDERIAPERKRDILAHVDGAVMDISELFNQYADSASYYDICLQIFYMADHRNAADIKSTWRHLIEDTHAATEKRGSSQPYEAVIEKVRSMGSRLRMSDTIFPIRELIPMLERYSLEHQRHVVPSHWIVDLFIELGVPYDSIFAVLEAMYYTDEAPFQGSNRRFIASDLLYLCEGWFRESVRLGGFAFGSDIIAERVNESLDILLQGQGNTQEMVERTKNLQRRLADLIR